MGRGWSLGRSRT